MISWLTNKFKAVDTISDSILIRRIKRGDRNAFGKLYLKYLDAIYRYIYFRVRQDRQTAEDLSETVFFKAWEHIKTFEEKEGTFKPWLYMIAKNTIIDYFRKPQKTVPLKESLPYDGDSIEEKLIKDHEVKDLKHALNLLTDEQKQVITLKYIEEMPNYEIAKILDKNEEAVRALQSRALKKLRDILK